MAAQPGAPLNASSTSELCFLPSISIEHPKEKEKKKKRKKRVQKQGKSNGNESCAQVMEQANGSKCKVNKLQP